MKKKVKYDYLHVLCICQGTQVAAVGGKGLQKAREIAGHST